MTIEVIKSKLGGRYVWVVHHSKPQYGYLEGMFFSEEGAEEYAKSLQAKFMDEIIRTTTE
jgi:hypothetical protein